MVDRLRVRALVGVDPQERLTGNDLEVTVTVDYPPAWIAGATDDLAHTVNYADLTVEILEATSAPALLLEHLAHLIITRIAARWPEATGGSVTIKKMAPPVAGAQAAGGMGITFRWSR